MALDAQSNWNVEMPQLRLPKKEAIEDMSRTQNLEAAFAATSMSGREINLPQEVVIQIVSCIPHRQSEQKTFWACCLVSRVWYSAAIASLYERPYIHGGNFQEFVATVCPSKNAHIRRSQLAELIRVLDMGQLVHDGSKSLTARLLGRLKGNLEQFVAPQASFSINSFAALSKCTHLKFLNLSLMSASISTEVLFHTLDSLKDLETLYFPRTSSREDGYKNAVYAWPSRLKELHIAGGVDDAFLITHGVHIPRTVERLSIQHCSMIYLSGLREFLGAVGPQLRHLTLRHPLNRLHAGALDPVLFWCPFLVALRVSADYVTDAMFEAANIPQNHPLQILELDCSPSAGAEVGIMPDAVWLAIDTGLLPNLRSVRVNARLAWQATELLRTSVSDLADLLEEQEKTSPTGVKPGVWSIVS